MLVGTRSFMLRRQLAIGGYGADRGIAWQCPPRPPPPACGSAHVLLGAPRLPVPQSSQ